jgi:hypothetical protein
MSPLKETAIRLIQDMPDEKIGFVLYIIKGLRDEASGSSEAKRAAYQDLLKLRRSMPDLDYDKELAEYRTERYANTN